MKPPELRAKLREHPHGDGLVDAFPGSGAITRAWKLYTSPGLRSARDASRTALAWPEGHAAPDSRAELDELSNQLEAAMERGDIAAPPLARLWGRPGDA